MYIKIIIWYSKPTETTITIYIINNKYDIQYTPVVAAAAATAVWEHKQQQQQPWGQQQQQQQKGIL